MILDRDSSFGGVPSYNGRALITLPVKLTMETDASTRGWGAYCQRLRAGGPWRIVERNQHINVLELKSAFLALQTFAATKSNMHILLQPDYRTAIAYYINQKVGTHSKPLSNLACTLWNWCLRKGRWNTVQEQRTFKHFEPRVFQDPGDWMLLRAVYLKIRMKWGAMDVDLYALRHNYQIRRY